jgi:hypothetical protein
VTVRGDDVFTGSASYYTVHINQVLAAKLDVGELARFYVEHV